MVIHALRRAGHDVVDIKEQKMFGKSDTEIVAMASRTRRIILTHDTDFLYQQRARVIILRFRRQRPENVLNHLLHFIRSPLSKKIRRIIVLTEFNVEFYA